MNYLYKTHCVYTFEEYKRFSWVLYKKAYVLFVVLFCSFMLIAAYVLKNTAFYIIAAAAPFIEAFIQNKKIKKTYLSNTVVHNLNIEFEFYDSFFVKKNEIGETKIPYNKLNKIIETKTNFYLMIANNQGFMLVKNNFPEGLEDFLRNIK